MKKRRANKTSERYTLMGHARQIHSTLDPGGQITVKTLNSVTMHNLRDYMSKINKETGQNKKFRYAWDKNDNVLITRIL